jgi:S1-C subfamily serine protease
MKKKGIILFLLYFTIFNIAKSQITESQAKSLLFNRITELTEYEGIYNIKSVRINSSVCNSEREVTINDRIAIIKINEELKVMSLTNRQEIGKIVLRYQNGYYGELITTGFCKYPNLKITKVWWDTEIEHNADYYQFAHSQIINEINRIKNYCRFPDYCQNDGQSWICKTHVKYKLEKSFPNKYEEPPSSTSSGSGVIISRQGHILTNRHVVEIVKYVWNEGWPVQTWMLNTANDNQSSYSNISTNIKVLLNGIEYDVMPVATIDKNSRTEFEITEDLILLKIVNPPLNLKYTILDLKQSGLGDEVYTLGYPLSSTLGGSLIYSNGYFSSESEGLDIYNMSINPGNSGGGIFNKTTGNLVGIATSRINDNSIGIKTEGICFGTRFNNLSQIIKSETTAFVDLQKGYNSSQLEIWDVNKQYQPYYKSQFSLLVRDSKFKPLLTVENNRQATVQIIAK